jgi:hypothetical protein
LLAEHLSINIFPEAKRPRLTEPGFVNLESEGAIGVGLNQFSTFH